MEQLSSHFVDQSETQILIAAVHFKVDISSNWRATFKPMLFPKNLLKFLLLLFQCTFALGSLQNENSSLIKHKLTEASLEVLLFGDTTREDFPLWSLAIRKVSTKQKCQQSNANSKKKSWMFLPCLTLLLKSKLVWLVSPLLDAGS